MKHGELIAIGGAYIDINAPSFPLDENGLHLESEVVGRNYKLEPGGSAVNFARMCSTLEMPTTFIGKVGKDEMGAILSGLLEKAGVEPLLVISEDVSTNISFNMVNASGASIMAVVGTANQALTADEVYAQASERITESKYLFLGGCFKLNRLLPAFVRLANDARRSGVKVVLDHARINQDTTEDEKQVVRDLALISDIYLPSADEFMQLWNVSSIDEGLRLMSQKAAGVTVVKNGVQGAVALVDEKVVTIPAYPVEPIHTVGAGDSFNAGFIVAHYKDEDLSHCIKFGCATAALKISQLTLPTYKQVAGYITNQS